VWRFKGRLLFLQSRLKRHSPESTAFSSFWVAITYGGRGLVASKRQCWSLLATVGSLFFHLFGEEVDGKNWARERWRTGDLNWVNSCICAQCQTIVNIYGPHANVFPSYHDIPIPTSLPLVGCHLKGEHQFLITTIFRGGGSGFHRGLEARTLQGIGHVL
jgi:hypothetical protein